MKNLFLGSGEVVRDRANSHVATHESVHAVLAEALGKIHVGGRDFIIEEIPMGRIVGESICVATRPGDEIVYAKRPNRWGTTRFVRNRTPEPSQSVVVILKKVEEGNFFILITAFIGSIAPPEPWDERNFAKQKDPQRALCEAKDFWNTHALVWGCEETIPGTESSECPW